jgi:nitrogen fixation NifU-like protein
MSSEIYRERIIEHYRNPRNYGSIDNAQIKVQESNPLCGDDIELYIKLDKEEKVEDIKFRARGCAVSVASASLMTELLKGKKIDELLNFTKKELLDAVGVEALGLNPVRIKCALLPYKALKIGIYSYLGREIGEEKEYLLEYDAEADVSS